MRYMASLTMALLVCSASLPAQSTPSRPPLFTTSDAWWSAAFLAGAIALSTADDEIAQGWNDPARRNPTRDRLARNFAKVQEGSLTVGNLALWGIARLTKMDGVADVTFHAAEAVVVGSLASQAIRGPLGRSRPHVTNFENQYDFKPLRGFREFRHRAFPSIHTASSFAVATVYTLEAKRRSPSAAWVVGPIAYALAAGPGISRMYTGQHWASDILAGGFVGTLAGAKVLRYNHDVNPTNRVNRFMLGSRNVQVSAGGSSFSVVYGRSF
jgi:membrane-associated phospholipid phosphatase